MHLPICCAPSLHLTHSLPSLPLLSFRREAKPKAILMKMGAYASQLTTIQVGPCSNNCACETTVTLRTAGPPHQLCISVSLPQLAQASTAPTTSELAQQLACWSALP